MRQAAAAAASEGRSGTAERVLQGAIRVLKRDGFAALSARTIAAEAGTNLALLNYYYGSKEQLLLAIFEKLDEELLDRQRQMYDDLGVSLAEKWRRAVAFYRRDLTDGYVRILQELTAYGYSNAIIGERVRRRVARWRDLIESTVRAHRRELSISVDPKLLASAVVSFWYGVEVQHLVGASERETRSFELLDEVGRWLERSGRRAGEGKRRARA